MNATRHFLRAATAADHRRVDMAFAGFDLADAKGYGPFLMAHARALVPIERTIASAAPWPGWGPRWPDLARDLADLGRASHAASRCESAGRPDEAGIWGMLYVIEGSRLGAAVLAERVGPGLPRRYLAGERRVASGWTAFQAALQAAAAASDEGWLGRVVSGAKQAFGRFEAAARLQMGTGSE